MSRFSTVLGVFFFFSLGKKLQPCCSYQCDAASDNDDEYKPLKIPVLDQLLDLMTHVPPSLITPGLLPHRNAVTRAEFHPARAAFLNLGHSGIARGFSRVVDLYTCPRAGQCCRRASQIKHSAGCRGILICCFNCNGKLDKRQ